MNSIFTPFPDTLWVRKEIKFGYSCSLGKILHSWYRQSSFLHSATPRARDGLSVSRVQDFAEKALVPKLDSYIMCALCINVMILFLRLILVHHDSACTWTCYLTGTLNKLLTWLEQIHVSQDMRWYMSVSMAIQIAIKVYSVVPFTTLVSHL